MTDAPDMEPAALEPCPFCGSPASLEHDSDHHGEWFNLGCSRHWEAVADDEPSCPGGRLWYTAGLDEEAEAIANWNRRAARSVPEAGKAVDETAHDLVMRSVSLLSSLLMESPRFSTELNDKFFTLRDDMRQWLVNQADAAIASSPAPPGAEPVAWRPTHRHKKRGSTYRVIAESRLQVDGDLDNEKVVIYQGEDGQIWVRVAYEFNDGRFEVIASPQPAPTGEIAGLVEGLAELSGKFALANDEGYMFLVYEAAAALTASEAEAADLRRKLEEHQDAEDKAAREMATVIQGLRNRATAAERKLEEAREALERAVGLVDAMIANDPNEPVSDSGHVALDLWKHEAESLRAISKGAEHG